MLPVEIPPLRLTVSISLTPLLISLHFLSTPSLSALSPHQKEAGEAPRHWPGIAFLRATLAISVIAVAEGKHKALLVCVRKKPLVF